MSRKLFSTLALVLALAVTLTGCGGASKSTETKPAAPAAPAEKKISYPEKEITLIVPWAAGGGTDLIARQLASLVEKDLGKPVVVVNKTGGGGLVGFQEIANAKPDGYTIGLISNSLLLQKYASPAFADYKNYTPLALVNQDPASLSVKADSPYKTLDEFLAAAKKAPGTIRIANSGPGAIWHVSALALEKKAGVKFKHVPYEGANPAAVAVAGGHVEATTASAAETLSLVEAGQIRTLAVAATSRLEKFPNIPTFKEAGTDLAFGVWRGMVAPKGIPAEVAEKLTKAFEKAAQAPEYKEFMKKGGFGIRYIGGAEYGKFMADEDGQYADLFKDLDIKKK